MQLSNDQQSALNYLISGKRSVFLTGNAGTGKSTIIREFRRLTESDKGVVYLAPTGIAALNIQGCTIHSFFRVPIGILGSDLEVSQKFRNMAKAVHTIVIDEISMVRADLMDAMDFLLRKVGNKNQPFGGKRLIMIGDLCQLPPVVTRVETDYFQSRFGSASAWCFQAPSFQDLDPKMIRLTESFRQKDPEFVNLLNRIRDGDVGAIPIINELVSYGLAQDNSVVLTATNRQAVDYNQARLDQLNSKEVTYTGDAWGKFFPHTYPVPGELVLKVGARVIACRNSESYLNGSIGVVTRLAESEIDVRFENTVGDVTVSRARWENLEYEFDGTKVEAKSKGTYSQFPLKLAWGMTIHKSQGQGFPSAFIHLGKKGAFAHGQLYVALSRLESISGLRLHSQLRHSDVIIDPAVVEFMRRSDEFRLE